MGCQKGYVLTNSGLFLVFRAFGVSLGFLRTLNGLVTGLATSVTFILERDPLDRESSVLLADLFIIVLGAFLLFGFPFRANIAWSSVWLRYFLVVLSSMILIFRSSGRSNSSFDSIAHLKFS